MSAVRKDLRPPEEINAASARVMIHPSCYSGPRHDLLLAGLEAAGYDLSRLMVHERGLGLMRELVRVVERTPSRVLLRRFDDTTFSREISHASHQIQE